MFRMLIADDEKTISQGLEKLVKSYNLDISTIVQAQDCLEAIEMVDSYTPEIILMDINMPRLNGLDAIEKIRDLSPASKIIIISGYDEFSYAQKAIDLGVFAYLLKPINYKKFKDVLEKALDDYKKDMLVHKESEKNQASDPLEYIRNNYRDPNLSLVGISSDLYLSTSYISKYIKEKTSHNFTDYLNILRINMAIELMKDKNNSLKTISDFVGYSSQHYFSRAFKNYKVLSPSDYRKRELGF